MPNIRTIMAVITRKIIGVFSHPHSTIKFLKKRLVKRARILVDLAKMVMHGCLRVVSKLFWSIVATFERKGNPVPIRYINAAGNTTVDAFWGRHTVNVSLLDAAGKSDYQFRRLSERFLKWRSSLYPLFKDFMQLYGNHDNEVILDYGCGPGHDLIGFLIYTKAKKVIGVDVSEKALHVASRRITAHKVDTNRVELICTSDSTETIPLDDKSIDYIHCAGVVHHTSNPEVILREFHRVLRPHSSACVMVYNYDSIYLHLYVAYIKMIIQNKFVGMDILEAFSKSTDTEECPISRCYRPEDFISMCKQIGFNPEYLGGYFSVTVLKSLKQYGQSALQDERLGVEHRDFLKNLVFDERGFPMFKGKHAGIGGVYRLYKGD